MVTGAIDDRAPDGGPEPGRVRIGEMARRVNVSPEVLRAWERRYGLFSPDRTSGGFRLYTTDDQRRALAMQRRIAGGVPPVEAAERTLEQLPLQADGATPGPAPPSDDPFAQLRDHIEGFNAEGAHAAIDRLSRMMSLDSLISHAVLPYLRESGAGWEADALNVAQRRFADHILRTRMLGMTRGWEHGDVGRALLACGPGECRELSLVCLGLALNGRGWGVTYLGRALPAPALNVAVRRIAPDAVVVWLHDDKPLVTDRETFAEIAAAHPTFLCGCEGLSGVGEGIGAVELPEDPVQAARLVHRHQQSS
jgi:MerR family transcriptional regulator, light-induced transcriptional regulator